MTFDLYQRFILTQKILEKKERLDAIRTLCDRLPDVNRALLESFFLFLKHVENSVDTNRMSSQNIAIIFAPSFLKSENETPQSMLADQNVVEGVLVDILGNPELMFGILNVNDIDEKYILEEQIGQTPHAIVSRCRDKETNEIFTMKSVKKGHLSPKEVRNLQSEIAILRKIRHPQVIALRAVCETKKKMFLVTEHVAGGGLF
mmetsp:Transcript_15052/g.21091  ORF Transcript_15052/g.21091 Transcript_15052/m.21091 type:complete len:203 (+) Transcript_15052:2-610(+)